MGNIVSANVKQVKPMFWVMTALTKMYRSGVLFSLVNREYDLDPKTKGDTVAIPIRGLLTVNQKLENQPVTLQTPANENKQIVLDTHNEISWLLEDWASTKAITDAVNYIEDAADSILEEVEKDIVGNYSLIDEDMVAHDLGDTPTLSANGFTIDRHILPAKLLLDTHKCPKRGRVMLIDSHAENAGLKEIEFISRDYGEKNADAIKEGYLGRKYGFDFISDEIVSKTLHETGVHDANIAHGIAFHKDGFVFVTRPLPLIKAKGASHQYLQANGVIVRLIQSYNPNYLGIQTTLDILYGTDIYRNGVEVSSDDDVTVINDLGNFSCHVPYCVADAPAAS